MNLIPSLSILEMVAAIPLFMVLGPYLLSTIESIMSNPLVSSALDTVSVMLNNTEIVWRPAWNASLVVGRQVLNALVYLAPIVKEILLKAINTTITLFRSAQAMGVSFTTAFPMVMVRMKELGEALVIIGRSLGVALYYVTTSMALVLGSFERVFTFSKQLVFEAHLITANDLYNAMLPLAIVLVTIATLYWLRKAPVPVKEECEPRRSSRLARKRAFLHTQDLSDALPACKKASAISSYL